jgi:hypothetical protein
LRVVLVGEAVKWITAADALCLHGLGYALCLQLPVDV